MSRRRASAPLVTELPVGRVGGLAFALGIGVVTAGLALAAPAQADTDSAGGNQSAASSSSSSSSTSSDTRDTGADDTKSPKVARGATAEADAPTRGRIAPKAARSDVSASDVSEASAPRSRTGPRRSAAPEGELAAAELSSTTTETVPTTETPTETVSAAVSITGPSAEESAPVVAASQSRVSPARTATAEHGEGLSDLYDGLASAQTKLENAGQLARLEPEPEEEAPFDPDAEPPPEDPTKPVRIAFVGRPNAGKSTLVNGILDDERFVTGPEAGITRDSVTVAWTWRDKEIRLVDTAGLRRRSKVQEKLERLSTMETTHSIRFADIVVLVMDPKEAFEKQDMQIANLALREGRGLVCVVTKWDAVEKPSEMRKSMEEKLEDELPHAKGVPLVTVSGITRRNLDKLMDACLKVHKDWSSRIKTRDLNDWLGYVTQKHPPPAPDGKRIKPRYMAQMKTRPPTFVLMASRAEDMPETYKRYLINEMREAFDLPGVPIRLVLRASKNPFADKDD